MSTEAAVAELHANSGSQFDPQVVAALVVLVEEWLVEGEAREHGPQTRAATAAAASGAPVYG